MKFGELKIKNFLIIGEATVSLANRGLLLIEGQNDDDESANSNGAGKSSLVDALCWCLFGVTARGVSGDAVINKKAKKECVVGVEVWTEDLNCYYIERGRKSKRLGNNLIVQHVVIDGLDVGGSCELTKTTVSETQKVVNGILGCSYEVFTSSIYAAQERMPDLPSLTDKMLKTLIEEAAGIDRLQKASEIAKDMCGKAHDQVESIQTKIGFADKTLSASEENIKHLQEQDEDFVKKQQSKIAELTAEKNAIEAEIAKIALLSKSETDTLEDRANQIREHLKNYSTLEAQSRKLQNDFNLEQNKCVMLKSDIEKTKKKVEGLKQETTNLDSKIGTRCGECGKIYQAEDLSTAKKAIESQIAKTNEELMSQMREFMAQVEQAKQFAKNVAEFKKKLPDVTALATELSTIENKFKKNQNSVFEIRSKKERAELIQKNILECEKTLNEESPYKKFLAEETEKISEGVKEKAQLEQQLLEAQEAEKVAESVQQLYSVKGIRAHILDTITPYLNERTAFYLNTLSDGEITATWQTLTKTAKGDFREKFSIEVQSVKGATCFAGLSGGEKRKVRIATSMALQDLVTSRAENPIGLYIADEVDHAIDASGLERLMTILDAKAKEHGTALVISHNSLRDWIDNTITVVKKDGTSSLVESK